MKIFASIFCYGALLFTLEGCVTKGTPILALGTPEFVPQSQPDSVDDWGIHQDPNTGGIFLQWYSVEGAAGYKVYRADSTESDGSPVDFSVVSDLAASTFLNDTSTVDVRVRNGVRYYYCVRSYASDGALSLPSGTINYELLTRPLLVSPAPNCKQSRICVAV